MNFNARTNVVSECCSRPRAAQQLLYSQSYYTCVTVTDVPKLPPAAHRNCLLYVLVVHPVSRRHISAPTCCTAADSPYPPAYFSPNWQAELLIPDPLYADVLIIHLLSGLWQI